MASIAASREGLRSRSTVHSIWTCSSLFLITLFVAIPALGQAETNQGTLVKPKLVLQDSHSGTVTAVAFSPDGKLLASAGEDGILKFWDAAAALHAIQEKTATDAFLPQLRSIDLREMFHEGLAHGRVTAVVFSPDGRELAVAVGNRLLLWSPTNQRVLPFPTQVNDIAFDPNNRWIAAASSDRLVRILDATTLQLRKTLSGHSDPILALAVNRDGSRLASGGLDKDLILWDTETGKKLHRLQGHTDWIRVLAFSPDGQTVASGSDDKTIKIWSADSGNLLSTLKTVSEVEGLSFTSDGRSLASGTDNGILQLWNFECGTSVCFDSDKPAPPGVRMRFVRGESGFFDFSFQNLRRIQQSAGRLALSPDGHWLARGGNNLAEIHELPSMRLSAILGRQIDMSLSRFSPDGRYLAFATGETIRLWETSTGRPKRTIIASVPAVSAPGSQTTNRQPAGSVLSLDFSLSGDALAAGFWHGVQLWETDTGKRLGTLAIPAHAVMDVRFSPDGNRIGTCTGQSLFQIWDKLTETELHRLDIKLLTGNSGCTLAFSQDGKLLATSSNVLNSIQSWDVSSGRTLSTFETTNGGAFHIANDVRNGAFAAVGNFGVKLWKRSIKQEPETLLGHTAWVNGASFSADGTLLATGSSDNTVRIWDVATGKEKQKFEGSPASPSFSLDNRWLLSNGRGAAVLWDLQSGEKKAAIISGRRDWLVVTPDGLFDGSPGAWNAVMWRFENSKLFDVLPAESFFNEFYRPGLLGDILNGGETPAPRPMASLDRRQPSLKFSSPGTPATGPVSIRSISLELNVQPAPAQGSFTSSSGARDVRIFRNGSLIQEFHGEIGGANLRFQAPIVAGPNVFTAYAFNDADVKSRNALFRVVGADSLKRKGTAYIVAMGVNQYANANYNLRYAAQDAREFADELKSSLSQFDTFAEVRVVSLIDADATKANLMDALHKLGGAITVSEHAPDSVRSLHAAQPEDIVLVYFAGHGTAAKSHFYLIPHDLGYQGNRDQLNEENLNLILEHSVSDEELQTAFEYIDARKLVLIIDACNSGQALEADEKRRGPMNSKGLAQLAYEKGMYVLTASQSYQAALEGEKLGHGLLTFALVEEGLKTPAAQTNSPSGELELRDWLEFAAQRVPELKSDLDSQSRLLKHEHNNAGPELETSSQQPRLFYREEPDATPLIIARLPARQ